MSEKSGCEGCIYYQWLDDGGVKWNPYARIVKDKCNRFTRRVCVRVDCVGNTSRARKDLSGRYERA